MALWGNIDGKHLTATTIIIGSNNTSEGYATLVGSGTSFTTELNNGDLIIVNQTGPASEAQTGDPAFGVYGDTYRVVRIHDDTNLTVDSVHENGIPVPDGADCGYVVYQQAPKYANIPNLNDPISDNKVMGADVTETTTSGKISHAGWVVRHAKIRDGVTSYWYETLVASSSISDDVPLPASNLEL